MDSVPPSSLRYLFDIELPLALCDISQVGFGPSSSLFYLRTLLFQIEAGIYECLNADGLTLNIPCIEGDFRDR